MCVCVAVTVALLVGTGQLFSCNKCRLTFMYISNRSDTQYNNSISSHAKDTNDVNLTHIDYNALYTGHKHLMV